MLHNEQECFLQAISSFTSPHKIGHVSMVRWKKPNQELDVDDAGATVIGSGSRLGTEIMESNSVFTVVDLIVQLGQYLELEHMSKTALVIQLEVIEQPILLHLQVNDITTSDHWRRVLESIFLKYFVSYHVYHGKEQTGRYHVMQPAQMSFQVSPLCLHPISDEGKILINKFESWTDYITDNS